MRYGFPDLWLTWPLTVLRTLSHACRPFYVLSSFEFWTRPYYERIARDFRTVGRWGYVWDEGLGVPFGPRIYNNTATYAVYGALSPRAFRLLAFAGYLAAVIAAGWISGHWILAVAVALVLSGSPATIYSLIACMVKPEVIWWSLAVFATTAALTNVWFVTMATGGLLLFVNTPVAVILGLVLAPLWLFEAWMQSGLPGGAYLLLLVPGVAKTAIRMMQARRDGLARSVAAEQSNVTRGKASPLRDALRLTVGFSLPMALAGWPMWQAAGVLCGSGILLGLANGRVVKLADTVTMLLLLLTLVIAMTLASGSWLGLLGITLLAFERPFSYLPAIADRTRAEEFEHLVKLPVGERLAALRRTTDAFPWFLPSAIPRPDAMMRLLAAIPDGARVLMESDADSRSGSKHLRFRNWADAIVSPRDIELVNQFFLVRLAEPDLAERFLDRFSAPALTGDQMREICCCLGVSHVLAFSNATIATLETADFQRVAVAEADAISGFVNAMHMPPSCVVLLASAECSSILSPPSSLKRKENAVRWEARAGTRYVLRYRHHPRFVAHQGGEAITLLPLRVCNNVSLQFMTLLAPADGEVCVEFR
jgi:hypothetical protein